MKTPEEDKEDTAKDTAKDTGVYIGDDEYGIPSIGILRMLERFPTPT
jgi:hypothetical protein